MLKELQRLYDNLLAGDAEAILALFSGEPHIDTPLDGAIRGEAAVRAFVARQAVWLAERRASPRPLHTIDTPLCVVVELVLDLAQGGEVIDLPIGLVADRQGAGFSAVRVYHSTWPLTGGHRVRPPLLEPPLSRLDEPPAVEAYMAALRDGNAPLILSLFTPDGYVRQPSGDRYRHEGPEGLPRFYVPALAAGGISLIHCTATSDGRSVAIEFIADKWGQTPLPPQAGLAVYDLAGDRLSAARIYDDVDPPIEEETTDFTDYTD
jgi:hypothetical protein